MTDTVFLKDLRVIGKHGVTEQERRTEQEFSIDILASFDTRKAAASDDLADTVNYSEFRRIAREIVGGNSFLLIERLAETIATRVLEDARITSVTVTVRKPAIYADALAGVSITRSRA